MRVLLTGWFSFWHGEATAGDVLSAAAVGGWLADAGVDYDVAWSRGFRADGVDVDSVDPAGYTHLVFVCGPAYGEQVAAVHRRFSQLCRIAVGVSVVAATDPAVAGFDVVIARDGAGTARVDLAVVPVSRRVPVVGVLRAPGQPEYADRRRHEALSDTLGRWLAGRDCARLPLDTRLDRRDWRLCATPDQLESLLSRLDLVVSTRLHGLVLALKNAVPVLAVDPVDGGAKVAAQAAALGWPAVLGADELDPEQLSAQWDWCLSPQGRSRAAHVATTLAGGTPAAAEETRAKLLSVLSPHQSVGERRAYGRPSAR